LDELTENINIIISGIMVNNNVQSI